MQIISVVIHFPDSPRPIFTVPFHASSQVHLSIYRTQRPNDSPSRYYQFQPRNNNHEGGGRSERKLSDLFLTDTMTNSSRESTKARVPFLAESWHDRSKPRIFQRNSCACVSVRAPC